MVFKRYLILLLVVWSSSALALHFRGSEIVVSAANTYATEVGQKIATEPSAPFSHYPKVEEKQQAMQERKHMKEFPVHNLAWPPRQRDVRLEEQAAEPPLVYRHG